jgi:DNA replication factor GINS
MSYIQKNQGNHSKNPVNRNNKDKSLKSINIDELLSDAQKESLINPDNDIKINTDDHDDLIVERYGSEPSRKGKNKNNSNKQEKAVSLNSNLGEDEGNTEISSGRSEKFLVADESKDLDTGKNTDKNNTKTLMILDELPSIIGVDKNVYGPASPQDLITIPEPNAKILVKNNKGIIIQTYK